MISQQIINQNNFDEKLYRINTDINDVIFTGVYGLVSPKNYFDNSLRNTYMTGVDNEPNRNPVLYRYNQSTDSVDGVNVGTIDNFDPLIHQHPTVFVIEDYVYIMMVNGHGTNIKLWKSNTTDILDGFTLHDTITGFPYGYIQNYVTKSKEVVFLSRITGGSPNYGQIVGKSLPLDYTSWTVINTTDPDYSTTSIRHYPAVPKVYGNNLWNYFGISLRDESLGVGNEVFFAQAFYKTQDFVTYYSLDENWSKDIVSNGAITQSEVETNLTYVGSDSNKSDYVGTAFSCVIDDVIYGVYYNSDNWVLYKIENGVKTDYDFYFDTTGIINPNNSVFQWNYNGNNLVVKSNNGKYYACDLDFNNQVEVWDFSDPSLPDNPLRTIVPYNLDKTQGKYMAGGSKDLEGVFPYYVLEDKFII